MNSLDTFLPCLVQGKIFTVFIELGMLLFNLQDSVE